MKTASIVGLVAAIAVVAFGIYFFDVDVTEEASLPDVDVTVEGGNLPEVDVEAGDIETGTEEITVAVPTIEIESPEEEAAETNTN